MALIPRRMKLSERKQTLPKDKGKDMVEKKHLRKQLDTIVHPQTNHTIVYQGCSWTTTLKICLGYVFYLGFKKASYILGNWAFLGFYE